MVSENCSFSEEIDQCSCKRAKRKGKPTQIREKERAIKKRDKTSPVTPRPLPPLPIRRTVSSQGKRKKGNRTRNWIVNCQKNGVSRPTLPLVGQEANPL